MTSIHVSYTGKKQNNSKTFAENLLFIIMLAQKDLITDENEQ